jgi:excisionase family DNA binding protein
MLLVEQPQTLLIVSIGGFMELLTVPEAAKHMRISTSFLYRLTAAGKIRFYKIGSTCRFTNAQLDEWINSREVLPATSDTRCQRKSA